MIAFDKQTHKTCVKIKKNKIKLVVNEMEEKVWILRECMLIPIHSRHSVV